MILVSEYDFSHLENTLKQVRTTLSDTEKVILEQKSAQWGLESDDFTPLLGTISALRAEILTCLNHLNEAKNGYPAHEPAYGSYPPPTTEDRGNG